MKKGVIVVSWTLEQPEDCCGRVDDGVQRLAVELHDGGGGHYAVISTARWAVEPGDLRALADEIDARIQQADEAEST